MTKDELRTRLLELVRAVEQNFIGHYGEEPEMKEVDSEIQKLIEEIQRRLDAQNH